MPKRQEGKAVYLTETPKRAQLGGVRVYIGGEAGEDVLFISRHVGPHRFEEFLMICPKCGETAWYMVGEQVVPGSKVAECCMPAIQAAMEAARA